MPARLSKGNRVNIPEPGRGDWPLASRPRLARVARASVECGDANELGDVGRGTGKSSLFFVRARDLPGIGSPGDRDVEPVKHRGSCGVRSAPLGPGKSEGDGDSRAGPYPYPQQVSEVNSL